jgi:hypothetical protein
MAALIADAAATEAAHARAVADAAAADEARAAQSAKVAHAVLKVAPAGGVQSNPPSRNLFVANFPQEATVGEVSRTRFDCRP